MPKSSSVNLKYVSKLKFNLVVVLAFAVCSFAACAQDSSDLQLYNYLNGAELQVETDDQRQEIKHALQDMLNLSPEELEKKRYKNYRMEENQWTLVELLQAYYLPDKPMALKDDIALYKETSNPKVKKIVSKLLSNL
jgi:hypothetical protein